MIYRNRATLALLGGIVLALAVTGPAGATSRSGTDSRPVPSRVFSQSSPFYQRLPNSTPTASDSGAMIASLNAQAHHFYGTATTQNVTINTVKYSAPLFVARNSDPAYNITAWDCPSHPASIAKYLNAQLTNVHVPADLQPDPSSDGSVSIYNPDSNELVELWQARKSGGKWQACWGGRISNASQSLGVFEGTFGASATGMASWATTIRQQELLDGHIDHVVGLSIPYTKKGSFSWPATRTDGWKSGSELSAGQMLRLPASLNIDSMKLSPVAKTIAKAAQQYGIVITDTSGSVSFAAENPISLTKDSYSTIFRGRWASDEMAGNAAKGEVAFPLDKLVALPINYRVSGTTTPEQPAPPVKTPTTNTSVDAKYTAAVKAANPWLYWRLSGNGSATDTSGQEHAGTMGKVTKEAAGAIPGNTAITTRGDWSSIVSTAARTTPPASFSIQLWFKTGTTSGGKLAGLENLKLGNGWEYDRSLYLANNGKLVFGTIVSGKKASTISSSRSYNDGAWHMVTATQSKVGTRLYVDGVLVASSSENRASAQSGYWRIGGGNLSGWPGAPGSYYVKASLDEFAIYHTALSADTIAAQYKSSR